MKAVWGAPALMLVLVRVLPAQGLAYEGGLSLTSGRYFFTERTTAWSLSTGLAYTAGPFTLRAAVPVIMQNTTLVTTSGAGTMASGGSSGRVVMDSGTARGRMGQHGRVATLPAAVTGYRRAVADPLVFASWRASADRTVGFTVGAGAKVPVTDTSDFGTGAWDAGGSVGLSARLGDRTLLGVDVAYWHLGDLPDLDFRDPVVATGTASRLLGAWAVSLSGSVGSSALRGYAAPLSFGVAAFRLGAAALGGFSLGLGLTETAPQLTMGLTWRVRLSPPRPPS